MGKDSNTLSVCEDMSIQHVGTILVAITKQGHELQRDEGGSDKRQERSDLRSAETGASIRDEDGSGERILTGW